MLSFLVFGAPTLNPNGTINVVEGTSDSLSCSRSPGTTGINARWTFGSTQLASSTDSVTYSYSNIMQNQSGDYNCTLTHNIGIIPYVVTRYAVVTINVQCESVNLMSDWYTHVIITTVFHLLRSSRGHSGHYCNSETDGRDSDAAVYV